MKGSDVESRSSPYQICSTTVMDTTVQGISFDSNGECHFCNYYRELAARTVQRNSDILEQEFNHAISVIKKNGKGKKYDCVLGVSGGQDSTYLALLAKRNGLRPLLVHFDNGWNSELAIKNIESLVTILDFDLHTFVMDWEEFRDIQRSYFLASVVDVEVPTDQFIFAALHRIAYKKKIKYILAGNNVVCESINPEGWVYKNKLDLVNLKAIHKKYGSLRLKKLPRLGLYERYYYEAVLGIQTVNLLDLINYNKKSVLTEIRTELKWRDYGGKHHESLFTRFYQGYYLPQKFGIDKRRAHWSNLILSGQANRAEAVEALRDPPYPIKDQIQDRDYVIKKLGFSLHEWNQIMNSPLVPHHAFESDQNTMHQLFFWIFRLTLFIPVRCLRAIGVLPKREKIGSPW